ncbi:hypothetical protein PtrSN002B_007841 [Pyrenophora tritici-repentis]|uniref:Uncharacterized protein n=2 Tax=Pyrenophora tritici-repentis TaxID=45151 RepID=A0A2W1DK64_9PLEO|nr:uncharacterized protein PTRG_09282 [Pyrenophora tritici-repentis Pt-1C-BFP]KAA8617405.1 hypothetical protein PtrV1_08912 [Pyrenophora tritici-repentis]EDU42333.1 hypothetical protein PTRG_09282 [Pyrenophora tritici-repentis Pt-1C-BFP]KAF7441841.1 hypothetical protein A1F99_136930 [Pyrenophora tritici-repentis]KAF7567848.1 hypothetical protein PtrM4_124610 [Pyrenophora tritici-repentis]KAG9376676.1 hypothetical protein A1F94_012276 [Pyrenophora tritici-repentis]
MRFSILPVLTLTLLGGLVAADCCKKGITYCGRGLLNKGNYYGEITTGLSNANQPNDADHVNDSLFYCGSCTDTPYQKFCGAGRCANGGSGKNDYCR